MVEFTEEHGLDYNRAVMAVQTTLIDLFSRGMFNTSAYRWLTDTLDSLYGISYENIKHRMLE